MNKILPVINFVLLLTLYAFCLFQPVDLTVQDLGRHIKNGQEILAGNAQVFSKNLYSYTMPENKFINHHWLSGIIFSLIFKNLGIKILILFSIIISLIVLGIFLLLLKNRGGTIAAEILGLPALLFLASRSEVRPEIFGYLFITIVLWQIHLIEKTKQIKIWQWVLLLGQQLLWVNLHISFVFAFYLIGLKLITVIWQTAHRKIAKQLIVLLISLIFISLINPNGLSGLLEPINIFTDYGYPIVENKSLYFLLKVVKIQIFYIYLIVVALEGAIFYLAKNKLKKTSIFWQILALSGVILGYVAKRNLPIFVLFSFPLMADCLLSLKKNNNWLAQKISYIQIQISIFLMLLLSIPLLANGIFLKHVRYKNRYLGFTPNQFAALNFFKTLDIQGNIFNNYDIGSYLIYGLYPNNKVFVDNRPEAYSNNFFQQTYIPMQENPALWQKMMAKYQFEAIFFGVRDLTGWGQKFLADRLKDPNWQVVYQNYYAVILVKSQ